MRIGTDGRRRAYSAIRGGQNDTEVGAEMKIQRAKDVDLYKVQLPCYVSTKIDGVRFVLRNGKLLSRTGKPFRNAALQRLAPQTTDNLEGELFFRSCRETTAIVNSKEHEDTSRLSWHIFDVAEKGLTWLERQQYLSELGYYLVPQTRVESLGQLVSLENQAFVDGQEGIVIRDPDAYYGDGYWRYKRFKDGDMVVTGLIQGLDKNKQPKLEVGAIVGTCELFGEIKVGPGNLTKKAKEHYWKYPADLIGMTIKYKYMPYGVKDKPRFPTFSHVREV